MARTLANELMAQQQMTLPNEVEQIQPDTQVIQYLWKDLPASTRERIKVFIRHKLPLDYDPTMVDPEW